MKLTQDVLCRAGLWIGMCLATMTFGSLARAAAVSTTTVQGTIYLANGAPGSGTLQLSWPAFTTADNLAVTAGRTTVTIGSDGFVSVNLAPNLGASPAGLFYTAVYHLSDGTTSTEYWVVPAAAQASLAAVRSQVMPAAQAVQAVSKAYVDNAVQSLAQGSLMPVGGTLSGPLYLNADPTQSLQAADKHYVDSAFSAAVPLSGATMVGALASPAVSASVNSKINVMAPPYNAKGDCSTDDTTAIQSAFTAAVEATSPTVVYFPNPPGGCYYTGTLTWTGQSLEGQPSMGIRPPVGTAGVVLKGKPGQDILHIPDPNVSHAAFNVAWSIADITFDVDDSVDASASFPHRKPGRYAHDAAITASSNQLTSQNSRVDCSDIGQPIEVFGAGPSGGNLITTISAVSPCWQQGNNYGGVALYPSVATFTLAANASTTVSNALVYVSLLGLPVTQTLGNAAIAADNYDANQSNWLPSQGFLANDNDVLRNVAITSVHGGQTGQNNSVGIYFQGTFIPYALDVQNLYLANVAYGVVQGMPDTNVPVSLSGWYVGQDYQKWNHGYISAANPWITYGSNYLTWDDFQLFSTNGPQILSVGSAEFGPQQWKIDVRESEGLSGTYGWRIKGSAMKVENGAPLCGASAPGWVATINSTFDVACYGPLNLMGNNNHVRLNMSDRQNLGTVTDYGVGNDVANVWTSAPGRQSSVPSTIAGTRSRGPYYQSGLLTGDFLTAGNAATPFASNTDLFFLPEDFITTGNTVLVTNDATSWTGRYADFGNSWQANNYANISGQQLVVGTQVPATSVMAYASVKCPSSGTQYWKIYANGVQLAQTQYSCTTSYQTVSVAANLTAYAGQSITLGFGGSLDTYVAWMGIRPTASDYVVASSNATINVQDATYKLACDGVTDDTTAFQKAVTAGDTSGTLLVFPSNASCLITNTISISGKPRWQGSNTTILMSPSSLKQQMFAGSNISALDISGFTFQGNSNTVAAFYIAGGTNQNINFSKNTFNGITGCPTNPNGWQNAAIILSAANHARIKDNAFLAGGCSNYWSTSGPTGAAVYNYTNPSYDWDLSGNRVDNTYAIFGFMLFNVFESAIHDNDIRDVVLGGASGNDDANSSGYGIAIYGTQICGNTTLASPSGLSRTSNVVTINFSGTCSPALVAGDHINVSGSTSVGGTGFDGTYTVTGGGTTSATAVLDNGISLANDTGGGANTSYMPRLNTVHDNRFYNLAGTGIYLQSNSDTTTASNVFNKVCQSMDDTSLPCGFVATNSNQRVTITGNAGSGSVKDGIIAAGSGIGVVLANNSIGGVRYGVRERGTDVRDVVMGNSVNGATDTEYIDGAAQFTMSLGNTYGGMATAAIFAQNSSANFNAFIANLMDGGGVTGVAGLQNISGVNNLIALNYAKSFRGAVFDIRTANNLVTLNYVYGGTGVGFSTGSASYNLVARNYLNSQSTGINDNSSGTSNVFKENYFTGATTAMTGINGWSASNYLAAGASKTYPVSTCTLVAGTCTITSTEVQSTDNGKIWCTRGSSGASPGFPYVSTITAGTSYVVTSTNAGDTGNVACQIYH